MKQWSSWQMVCSLMKVKSIAECSLWSILQYFWPALSDNLSWKSFFVLFESVLHRFYTGLTVLIILSCFFRSVFDTFHNHVVYLWYSASLLGAQLWSVRQWRCCHCLESLSLLPRFVTYTLNPGQVATPEGAVKEQNRTYLYWQKTQ